MKASEFRKWLAKQADSLGDAISGLSEGGGLVNGHEEANRLWNLSARLNAEARKLQDDDN